MSFLRLAVRSVARPRLAIAAIPSTRSRILQSASYSAAAGLSKEQVTSRVLDVLKGFEKVDQSKVSCFYSTSEHDLLICVISQLAPSATFAEDLGLDSLDTVEVVMAVEEVRLSSYALTQPYNESFCRSFLLRFRMLKRTKLRQFSKVCDDFTICVSRLTFIVSFTAIDYIQKTPDGECAWIIMLYRFTEYAFS